MIRIVHTACAALLVAVALIAYGVKEETRALQGEIEAVERETDRVEREIAALEIEWSYLNSPAALHEIAVQLYGRDGMVGLEGEPLTPWTPARTVSLDSPAPRRSSSDIRPLLAEIDARYGRTPIETATTPLAVTPLAGPPNAAATPGAAR